jgi:heterodisulfide reductase subunit A
MKASLMLAGLPGKKVYLVERLPITGGKVIKNEESFPNLECSTCMVAPIQQAVLQNPNIETLTYSTVEKISGEAGDFTVTVRKKARYVSMAECIGCGMCFEACPVELDNEWEESLMQRKAIYIPCSGALPNVPVIDSEHCLHLNGSGECSLCVESCAFEAVKLDEEDELLEIGAGAVILAAGSECIDLSRFPGLGYGKLRGVYSPFEFERLFASNGPTQGEIRIRGSEEAPGSVAIVHCIGREQQGYCSAVCCMYAFKFIHFLRHKIPGIKIHSVHSDVCVPGKGYQEFYEHVLGDDTEMLFTSSVEDVTVSESGKSLKVSYPDCSGSAGEITVDMVILTAAIVPDPGLADLAGVAGVDLDSHGFVKTAAGSSGSTETTRKGVFVAGTAEGPKDIQTSVTQAESAAGEVMAMLTRLTVNA